MLPVTTPPEPQHARHLGDRPARVGEAVQAGERDDQVHRTVRERQGPHVGQPRLDLLGHPARARGASVRSSMAWAMSAAT